MNLPGDKSKCLNAYIQTHSTASLFFLYLPKSGWHLPRCQPAKGITRPKAMSSDLGLSQSKDTTERRCWLEAVSSVNPCNHGLEFVGLSRPQFLIYKIKASEWSAAESLHRTGAFLNCQFHKLIKGLKMASTVNTKAHFYLVFQSSTFVYFWWQCLVWCIPPNFVKTSSSLYDVWFGS